MYYYVLLCTASTRRLLEISVGLFCRTSVNNRRRAAIVVHLPASAAAVGGGWRRWQTSIHCGQSVPKDGPCWSPLVAGNLEQGLAAPRGASPGKRVREGGAQLLLSPVRSVGQHVCDTSENPVALPSAAI